MYRNHSDIISVEGISVDAGSLWAYNQETDMLILVDEDQHATHPLTDSFELE